MADEKYRRLIKNLLNKKSHINEGRIKYDDDINERISPQLEDDLRNRKHSLGEHPIFPDSDEYHFEERLVGERFSEIVREVKRHFNIDNIDNEDIMENYSLLLNECMSIESKNKKILEDLAVKMITEEFDIPEGQIDIEAELVPEVNLKNTKLNNTPTNIDDIEFESHNELSEANEEIYKRRFVNSIIQGAGMKTNHMFNIVDEDLLKLNPTLPTKYNRLMSLTDYHYFIVDKLDEAHSINGGVSYIELPKTNDDNIKPKIIAKAIVFPALIHELTKGVMELLSANGLPKNEKIREYALNKADYLNAELWDMRMGPAIWKRFINCIPPEDFKLKHYLYTDLVSLPTDEFNDIMKEVMINSKRGKNVINEMLNNIKNDFKKESFEEELQEKREKTKNDINYIDDPDDLDNYWDNLGL